jgi:peptidyl-prolyl cis-trans isomerase SurA
MAYTLRALTATLALLIGAALVTAVGVQAEIIEQILVKVNGEIFTKTDLETRQVLLLRQRGEAASLKGDAGDEGLRKALADITPQLLVDVVDEMLVVQRGKELGYTLSDEQFKTVLDNLKKENKIETDEQLQAALKAENMTLDDLRGTVEKQMIISRVQQNEVFGKIGVSEDEARTYFDAHLSEFTTLPTVTLREILVAVPGDSRTLNVGLDDAARQKAEQLRARILAGDSFEKLAADVSDAPSRANAGLIGPLSLGDISPELRKVIETMKVGQVADLIRSTRGYQLLKLESSTPVQTLPFEQAREQIADRVFTGKRLEAFVKYVQKLRSEAIIEWKNQDIKKTYDDGLALRAKALPASPL